MKCRQAQDLIGAYIYGDLTPDEMRDLRVHAQQCALCREDLASRGRIVSSLDSSVPELSDEDRQRISWSVKGAIRKEQLESRPLIRRLVPAFALTGVLVAGIVVGKYMTTQPEPPRQNVARETNNSPEVNIEELPKADGKADPIVVADQISQLLQALANPNNTGMFQPDRNSLPGRAWLPDRRGLISPEDVFVVPEHKMPAAPQAEQPVPDTNMVNPPKDSAPAVDNTDTGADSETTQLPRVTDPKNAETTPQEEQ